MNTSTQSNSQSAITQEDAVLYLMLGFSMGAQKLYSALVQMNKLYAKNKPLQKVADNVGRNASGLYNALRSFKDLYDSTKPTAAQNQIGQSAWEIMDQAMTLIAGLDDEGLSQFAGMMSGFQTGEYRAINAGVYEAIEQAPFDNKQQARELVHRFCPDMEPMKKEFFVESVAQLAAYQYQTEKLSEI